MSLELSSHNMALSRYFDQICESIPEIERSISEKARMLVLGNASERQKLESKLPVSHRMNRNIQNTIFVLDQITENPFDITLALFRENSGPRFKRLVDRAIPAAFGYFCSYEMLEMACRFYKEIMRHGLPEMSPVIVAPLLNSCATIRFVESFFFDISKMFNAKMLNKETILKVIENNVCLLPNNVVKILRKCKVATHLSDVMWSRFLKGQSDKWCKRFGDVTKMKPTLDTFFKDKAMMNAVNAMLKKKVGLFELPRFVWNRTRNFVMQVVSVSDICCVANFLVDAGLMPQRVSVQDFGQCDADDENYVFRVKHYIEGTASRDESVEFISKDYNFYTDIAVKMETLKRLEMVIDSKLALDANTIATHVTIERANAMYGAMESLGRHFFVALDRTWNEFVLCTPRTRELMAAVLSESDAVEIRRMLYCVSAHDVMEKTLAITRIMCLAQKFDGVLERSDNVIHMILSYFGVTGFASVVVILNTIVTSRGAGLIDRPSLTLWNKFAQLALQSVPVKNPAFQDALLVAKKQAATIMITISADLKYCL